MWLSGPIILCVFLFLVVYVLVHFAFSFARSFLCVCVFVVSVLPFPGRESGCKGACCFSLNAKLQRGRREDPPCRRPSKLGLHQMLLIPSLSER